MRWGATQVKSQKSRDYYYPKKGLPESSITYYSKCGAIQHVGRSAEANGVLLENISCGVVSFATGLVEGGYLSSREHVSVLG